MHRVMAPRRPARPARNKLPVRHLPNRNIPRRELNLRMTLQTKIIIPLRQHRAIDRPMRRMTHRATLPQRLMLEHIRPCLLLVTIRASLIQPRHRQRRPLRIRWFKNIVPMRIMAAHAIHPILNHRMMLRQIKLRMRIQMTIKTSRRVLPRIDDELPAAAPCLHMLAPRPMTTLAPRHPRKLHILLIKPPMRARRESPGNISMTIRASLIPHEMRAKNLRRRRYRPFQRGASR